MKKIYSLLSILSVILLLLLSLYSCVNTAAEGEFEQAPITAESTIEIHTTAEGAFEQATITTESTIEIHTPIDSDQKAYVKERYGNFSHYKGSIGYCNGVYFSTISELPDGAYSIPHSTPKIFDLSQENSLYTQADVLQYISDHQNKLSSDEILSVISLGMTSEEYEALLGKPTPFVIAPQKPEISLQVTYDRILSALSVSYPSVDGKTISFTMDYAGTGTEADPFRTVISEIWCDGELIAACNTVAEEMELGILPTFLAVELHGTDYLISEGLLTEAEAVLYAEEQAVYQASQAELDVETRPTPEIQVSDSEAIQ